MWISVSNVKIKFAQLRNKEVLHYDNNLNRRVLWWYIFWCIARVKHQWCNLRSLGVSSLVSITHSCSGNPTEVGQASACALAAFDHGSTLFIQSHIEQWSSTTGPQTGPWFRCYHATPQKIIKTNESTSVLFLISLKNKLFLKKKRGKNEKNEFNRQYQLYLNLLLQVIHMYQHCSALWQRAKEAAKPSWCIWHPTYIYIYI